MLRTLTIALAAAAGALVTRTSFAGNPIITDVFTADPAAIVHDGRVYIYCGQDEARPNQGYTMRRWLVLSSDNMRDWTRHESPLAVSDFSWAKADAWASHVVERDGRFYWFVTVEHDETKRGKAIGVAVSDSPTGPFRDARGSALITADMTPGSISWEDIDPAVLIDDDGTAYLYWGNQRCYYARLKPNLTELDGEVREIEGLPRFTEAPYVHKRGDTYYLSYASGFPETISYATAPSAAGPWTPRGLLAEMAGNSNTIHQSIIEFNGQSYFIYHNGGVQAPNQGGSFRRAVCIDYLYYNPDGTMRRVVQTSEGTDVPPEATNARPATRPAE